MRPPRIAIWFAAAGFFLAVSFIALGGASIEPSDHPRWLMAGFKAGSRPITIPYVILAGFCAPSFWVNYVLLAVTSGLLGFHELGGRPGGAWNYLTYPLLQGALYGGVAWALVSLGRALRKMFLQLDTSPGTAAFGSSPGAWPSQGGRFELLGIVAVLATAYSMLSLYLFLPNPPTSWTADYDEQRYAQIRDAIAADPTHFRGQTLDEVTKALSLEDVPWDDSTVIMLRMHRIYHFRGFALDIRMRLLPRGITPGSNEAWPANGEDLRLHGVLWLDAPPHLRIDGISDGKERMKRFWKAIDESYKRENAEMDRRTKRAKKMMNLMDVSPRRGLAARRISAEPSGQREPPVTQDVEIIVVWRRRALPPSLAVAPTMAIR